MYLLLETEEIAFSVCKINFNDNDEGINLQ